MLHGSQVEEVKELAAAVELRVGSPPVAATSPSDARGQYGAIRTQ